ncbi:MAG: GNAT family protein [Candidatus Dormiibacterota bacterium]
MSHWPLYDLRLRTERLELRLPDHALLEELVDLAIRVVHRPDLMPFGIPWTDLPSPRREREAVQYHLRQVADWRPESWTYDPVAIFKGRVVGVQELKGADFAITRSVSTGSWLGLEHQGQGLGQEMRGAVLELAFAHLGAVEALSSAFHDNRASLRVSHALGYVENGSWLASRRGLADRMIGLRLTREGWERHRHPGVAVEGLEACRELFGPGDPPAAGQTAAGS